MEDQDSFPPDSEDVREQIEQQRSLAAQLKEKLEQEELQLASKEQKNEVCDFHTKFSCLLWFYIFVMYQFCHANSVLF